MWFASDGRTMRRRNCCGQPAVGHPKIVATGVFTPFRAAVFSSFSYCENVINTVQDYDGVEAGKKSWFFPGRQRSTKVFRVRTPHHFHGVSFVSTSLDSNSKRVSGSKNYFFSVWLRSILSVDVGGSAWKWLNGGPCSHRIQHISICLYTIFSAQQLERPPSCQRRVKTAHSWRVKIAHYERGDDPQCVSASFLRVRRDWLF
jgi:hypothetical protein